ncbi:glutaredoxin family protein [Psychrobacter sp. CAL346-MNA-CIBAN-0220]|uniref:glutaredoxin family protein n=1 Tax=Psychrobacter sp. CAL346-MNA-CIBAN-0220 TaxID=3140457 RepID=UPI00332DE382
MIFLKKFSAILGITVLIVSIYLINDSAVVPDSVACDAADTNDIVLYGAVWCGYCEQTRQLLASHNVDYCEYDIERSAEGYNQYKSLGGGGVPLVLFNGEVIRGYNKPEIEWQVQNQ